MRRTFWFAVAFGVMVGCRDAPAVETRRPSSAPAGEGGAPYSLDSALVLFRKDVVAVADLENSEPSMEQVVARLARSVAGSDTNDLRKLVMSRREFAYLYYPGSPFTRAPTKQEPALAWFFHVQQSQKGVTRLLNRYGGKSVRFIRNDCKAPARTEGENVLWDDCVQRLAQGGDTVSLRLFSGIYERNGRFKIFSYNNDF